MRLAIPIMLAAATLAPAAVFSDEVPPKEAKPMLEVVQILEEQGYGPIVDVSFDDGGWEVEAYRGSESLELAVDPLTGKILSEHRDDSEPRPPQDALKLSEILTALAEGGVAQIEEASFERRYWEVETRRDGAKYESHVDPKTGNVVSERLDD